MKEQDAYNMFQDIFGQSIPPGMNWQLPRYRNEAERFAALMRAKTSQDRVLVMAGLIKP